MLPTWSVPRYIACGAKLTIGLTAAVLALGAYLLCVPCSSLSLSRLVLSSLLGRNVAVPVLPMEALLSAGGVGEVQDINGIQIDCTVLGEFQMV